MSRNKVSRKKVVLRIISPVLIAGAFAGLAGVTDAAAAPAQQLAPRAAEAAAQLTQGFDVRNLSSHTVTLTGIDSPGNGDGTPALGTVLRPGESLHYEKVFWFGNTPKTKLTFSDANRDGTKVTLFQVELWVDSFLNTPSVMMPYSDGKVGDIEVQGLGYTSHGINFVDKPGGAAITVSPQEKQQQADLLNRLCIGGQAACTFKPTSSGAGPDLVQRKLTDKNIGTTPLTVNFKQAFTFGATTSVELSASANSSLFGLVNATMSGKYGQGWSESRTEEITRTFTVPAGRKGIVEVVQPTIRQVGTFTVTMGNSRWELTDVYFDIPDKNSTPEVHVGDVPA